jgi:hypothetical protein
VERHLTPCCELGPTAVWPPSEGYGTVDGVSPAGAFACRTMETQVDMGNKSLLQLVFAALLAAASACDNGGLTVHGGTGGSTVVAKGGAGVPSGGAGGVVASGGAPNSGGIVGVGGAAGGAPAKGGDLGSGGVAASGGRGGAPASGGISGSGGGGLLSGLLDGGLAGLLGDGGLAGLLGDGGLAGLLGDAGLSGLLGDAGIRLPPVPDGGLSELLGDSGIIGGIMDAQRDGLIGLLVCGPEAKLGAACSTASTGCVLPSLGGACLCLNGVYLCPTSTTNGPSVCPAGATTGARCTAPLTTCTGGGATACLCGLGTYTCY